MNWMTDSVDKSPVGNLIGPTDFSVTVQRMHAGVGWNIDIIWMAR